MLFAAVAHVAALAFQNGIAHFRAVLAQHLRPRGCVAELDGATNLVPHFPPDLHGVRIVTLGVAVALGYLKAPVLCDVDARFLSLQPHISNIANALASVNYDTALRTTQ
jgi:hypothetical protein